MPLPALVQNLLSRLMTLRLALRLGLRLTPPLRPALLLAAVAALWLHAPVAQAVGASNFDHLTTGWPLTGQHQAVRCEDCHVRGIFKGTPAQCSACHTPGALVTAVMIPKTHFPTAQPCDSCHTTATFYGAHFPHSDVAIGSCTTCHNGVFAKGKNTGHLATTASCDSCHTTVSFKTAYVSLPVGHIPTPQACATCHNPAAFVPGAMNHANTSGTCVSCHAASTVPYNFTIVGTRNVGGQPVLMTANGQNVVVEPLSQGGEGGPIGGPLKTTPINHIPVSGKSCDLCHTNGNFNAGGFVGGVMNHTGITNNCAACHADNLSFTGANATSSPALVLMSSKGNHIPIQAGQDCSVCHSSTTSFLSTPMNHTGITSGCAACHADNLSFAGANATSAPPLVLMSSKGTHIPIQTGQDCSVCHSSTVKFSGTTMNHAGITSGCQACHEAGLSFFGVSPLAVRPSSATDSLHPTAAASADCATCHAQVYTTGAFNIPLQTALPTTGAAPHIPNPGGQACTVCHTAVSASATVTLATWSTYTMGASGHSGITASCQSCHENNNPTSFLNISSTGTGPGGIVVRPISTTATVGVTPPDPTPHPAMAAAPDCGTCHSSGFAAGDFLKNIKPASHIPTASGVACATCHTSASGFSAVVLPMPHTGAVTGTCGSCHGQGVSGSGYLGPFAGASFTPGAAGQGTWGGQTSGNNFVPRPIPASPALGTAGGHIPLGSAGATYTECNVCHLSTSAFGPNTAMVHTGINSGCQSCHEAGQSWLGVSTLAVRPSTATDSIHPAVSASSDCVSCHAKVFTTGAFNIPTVLPAVTPAHIPNPGAQACTVCHTTVSASATVTLATWSSYVMGATGHTGISTSCETCHENNHTTSFLNISSTGTGSAGIVVRPDTTAVGVTPADTTPHQSQALAPSCIQCHSGFTTGAFKTIVKPAGHIAVASGSSCNTCHTSGFSTVVLPMPHTGAVSGTCGSCHGQGISNAGYLGPFAGASFTPTTAGAGTWGGQTSGNNFVPRPIITSPAVGAAGGHIPLGSTATAYTECGVCHLSTSTFGPSTAMVHTGITTGCQTCHEAGQSWYGVSTLAVRPSTATDSLHPVTSATSDCATCHAQVFTTGAFNIPLQTALPTTGASPHMPNPGAQACTVCHTAVSAQATVTLSTWATYTMGASGHAGITTACEACHENNSPTSFLNISSTGTGTAGIVVRPTTAQVGITAPDATPHPAKATAPACASCHSGFTTGAFNTPTTPPTGHIAYVSGTTCATCHTSGFATVVLPMPHTGVVTGTCGSCHGQGISNSGYLGPFAGASFTPTTAGAGTWGGQTSGKNFVPRPIITSPAVGAAGGHIPLGSTATAYTECGVCHLNTSTFGPSTAMVHTGITTGCQTCHEAGQSWYGVSTLAVRPSTATDSLHPVTSATSDCATCHAQVFTTGAFNIPTVLPATTPVHMPNPGAQACTVCHTAVSAGATVTLNSWATYTMGASGHTGISTACETCHENNNPTTFLNMASTATGTGAAAGQSGIVTRPPNPGAQVGLTPPDTIGHPLKATAPACASCHSGFATGNFNTTAKPTGHIAVAAGAACTTCHTNGTTTVVLPMPHTGAVSGTCGSCHGQGVTGSGYLGPFAGASFTPTTAGAGTWGGQTSGLNFVPRQIITTPAIGASGGHIQSFSPTYTDCGTCHISTSAFGPSTAMVHTGITTGCVNCHYPGAVWYGETYTASTLVTTGNKTLSPVHVPLTGSGLTTSACENCHSTTVFTSFGTTTTVNHTSGKFMTYANLGNKTSYTGTPLCKTCHGPSGAKWYGVSLSAVTVGSHQGSSSSQDCGNCHSKTSGNFAAAAASAAVAKRAASAGPHGPGGRPLPGIAGLPYPHVGVLPGRCADCHSAGGSATAMPVGHLPTALSCDNCHRTSTWLPALFAHNGVVTGSCASCHAPGWATAKPAGHLLTTRACDTCHHSTGTWLPVSYTHTDLVYTPHPATVTCVACHATGTEQVLWKFPNLKPGCGGCHGPLFNTGGVRRSKGPAQSLPRVP